MTDAEKMQKLQEAMDNFLSGVAQRAETAKAVSETMQEEKEDYDSFDDGEVYGSDSDEQSSPMPAQTPYNFADDEVDETTHTEEARINPDDFKM